VVWRVGGVRGVGAVLERKAVFTLLAGIKPVVIAMAVAR